MADGEEERLASLSELSTSAVCSVIVNTWNFGIEQVYSDDVNMRTLRNKFKEYLQLGPDISFDIILCMLQNGPLTFGQAVWALESTCHRLYKSWLSDFNLQQLCDVITPIAKHSILELLVNSDDDVLDIHFAKCFINLRRLIITFNNALTNDQVRQILSHCQVVEELNLKGCANIDDNLFSTLWKIQSIQDNLHLLDICNTRVSPSMAATLYFLLPELHLLLYDDISGFLRYRCHMLSHNENVKYSRKVHRVRLGDTGFQRLRFINDDKRVLKEMELLLPNYDANTFDIDGNVNVFKFQEDANISFNFQDVYLAMCSVAPHFSLGCCPESSYLNEVSLINVKDIDLNILFSDLTRLKKLSLWHSCTTLSIENEICTAEALTELEFWFVSNEVVKKTLKHCHNLESLILRSVVLTAETFKDATFNCIKHVKVYYCDGYSAVENVFRAPTVVEIWHEHDSF